MKISTQTKYFYAFFMMISLNYSMVNGNAMSSIETTKQEEHNAEDELTIQPISTHDLFVLEGYFNNDSLLNSNDEYSILLDAWYVNQTYHFEDIPITIKNDITVSWEKTGTSLTVDELMAFDGDRLIEITFRLNQPQDIDAINLDDLTTIDGEVESISLKLVRRYY